MPQLIKKLPQLTYLDLMTSILKQELLNSTGDGSKEKVMDKDSEF